jgi:putative tryptophan/tyrosine transport system substrate-binding protein
MNRREFIAALGGAATWPLVARGQQAGQPYRIAWVTPSAPIAELTEKSSMLGLGAFFSELRALDYVEGQNLVIDRYSGAGRPERYGEVARDVIARRPDVIVTISNAMTQRLQFATDTIPIISMMADPITTGLTTSLAHPNGNLTGVSIDAGTEIWSKRLAFLKEMVPRLSRACFLSSKRMWEDGSQMTPLRDAARQLDISLSGCSLEGPLREGEYRRAFAALSLDRPDAIVAGSEAEQFLNRRTIVELVEKTKLPAVYPFREYAELGGLIFYGTDLASLYRQMAQQVDQVLKGAKPSEIPIRQPTKFELIINLKTANALGLTVPPSLLARADQVIE